MSMNEKQIVGESFEDLSDRDMAMLTGRGDDRVAPASFTPTMGEFVTLTLISIQVCTRTLYKCK